MICLNSVSDLEISSVNTSPVRLARCASINRNCEVQFSQWGRGPSKAHIQLKSSNVEEGEFIIYNNIIKNQSHVIRSTPAVVIIFRYKMTKIN